MKRINIIVEGQAEETYINEVLSIHLAQFNVGAVARRVEFSRRKQRIVSRGGLFDYSKLRRDVTNWLKQDRESLVTTMVDLYHLPSDFPKRGEAKKITNPFQKVALLESAFAEDIDSKRFIPNIQLHEFEAILFVNIAGLRAYYPDYSREIARLKAETDRYTSPEEIDEGTATAPSKRILKYVPIYDKVVGGSLMAMDIGLPVIRSRCQHFHQWLMKLEALAPRS